MHLIERNSSIPLYHQFQDIILDKINRGELEPGDKLPPVKELCNTYKISRITVVKAFDNLKNDGILESIQGTGYFIKRFQKINQQIFELSSFTDDIKKYNLSPSSTVLECTRITPSKKIARIFDTGVKDQITYIARVRKANDEALLIEKTYINDKYCPGISEYDFSTRSLYFILSNDYKLVLNKSTISFESVILRKEEAEIFSLPGRQPAFLSTVLVFLNTGQTIEYTKQIFRGDRYRVVGEANG